MKKLIPYLSLTVLILAVFGFMNPSFAQTKQTKAKASKKVEQPAVKQTKAEQPKVEEQVQQPKVEEQVQQPVVETQTPEVTKKSSSFSVNFDFGYDVLAKFKELTTTEDGETNLDSFTSSDKSAKYMDLKLSINILTQMFRFGFGLGYILPKDFDNKVALEVPPAKATPDDTIDFEQKLEFGVYLQLLQFGVKFDFDYVDLIPYAGVNVLYLKAKDSLYFEEDDQSGTEELYKVAIPVYAGFEFAFVKLGPVNFHTGFEIGYAIKVLYKNDVKDWGYHNKVGDIIADESDPLAGLTGKITLGTSLCF